jgi:dihydroflavonol-4-reductase
LRVLRAAHDAGISRVVMTSSFTAVGYGAVPRDLYTEADWTDPNDENTAYIRSKAIAERAAWDLVESWNGETELTVINPVGIFGPALGPKLSTSLGFVKALLDGAMPVVPRQIFGVVDVRDVAELHIRAMLHPDAVGERFLAVSGMSSFFEVGQTLRRRLGDIAAAVPERELTDDEVRVRAVSDPALKESVSQLGRTPVISSEKARRVLAWSPRDVEDTLVDSAESLMRLGLVAN